MQQSGRFSGWALDSQGSASVTWARWTDAKNICARRYQLRLDRRCRDVAPRVKTDGSQLVVVRLKTTAGLSPPYQIVPGWGLQDAELRSTQILGDG